MIAQKAMPIVALLNVAAGLGVHQHPAPTLSIKKQHPATPAYLLDTLRGKRAAHSELVGDSFYSNYPGHRPEDLQKVYDGLNEAGCQSFIWLAGDSTLDNTFFFSRSAGKPPVNGYGQVLALTHGMRPDVSYLLNEQFHQKGGMAFCAINTARAGSTLGERIGPSGILTDQDKFLRDHFSKGDVVIVSVGGNDMVVGGKAQESMVELLGNSAQAISTLTPEESPALEYLVHLFRDETAEYINKLRGGGGLTMPITVIVCSPYFFDLQKDLEMCEAAWLQAVIKRIFELATSQIQLNDAQVVRIPMYETLDGKTPADYFEDGIHLTEQGGRKMAQALFDAIP